MFVLITWMLFWNSSCNLFFRDGALKNFSKASHVKSSQGKISQSVITITWNFQAGNEKVSRKNSINHGWKKSEQMKVKKLSSLMKTNFRMINDWKYDFCSSAWSKKVFPWFLSLLRSQNDRKIKQELNKNLFFD